MADLTEQNIREIELLVEARGVDMKELSYDLVDHICCMIEEKMESGKNYTSALEESIASFGKKGIQQIQEETTFLLTKNILAMRKTMHITGITAAILLLLGTIFKIQHWPGAAVLYVLGAASLCLIFMPVFLTVRIKEKIGKLRLWINISGTLSAFVLCCGILFKIMHWPWAGDIMGLGGILVVFIYLPLYIFNYYKNKELRTNTVITTVVAIAGASMLFSLVSLRSSYTVRKSIVNMQYTINNNIEASQQENKTLFLTLKEDSLSDNATLHRTQELVQSIDQLCDDLSMAIAKSLHTKLSDTDVRRILTSDYLQISDNKGDLSVFRNKEHKLAKLLSLIDDYKKSYASITHTKPVININQENMDLYLNHHETRFPLGIVIHDLSILNLQIQCLQTSLLQYYKGKVS